MMMRKAFAILAIVLAVFTASSVVKAGIEIIIDNPNAEFIGSWTTAALSTTRYGDDYCYCPQRPYGTNSATYTPFIPCAASDWGVYTWYPAAGNRPIAAQFIVHTGPRDDAVYVNQQVNGQQWFRLGTYSMSSGADNWVRITNCGSQTDKVVMADAVRFHSPSASSPPDTTPPEIASLLAEPEVTKAVISWTTDEPATTQIEYGESASYGSETPRQSALTLNHSVTITSLTFPAIYHFRAKSADLYDNMATSADITFTTSTEIPQTPSFRAAWANTGYRSAAEVTAMIQTLSDANYNVVIPEVRAIGDAYYNSAYENRATHITDPPPFDPLADMITKGHAAGIEVHPWLSIYRIARSTKVNAPPVFYEHPEWLSKDSAGVLVSNDRYTLDQGVPGVQDYLCKVVLDVVSKYDVDGINLDYIRYQGDTWGYNEITKQRFYDEYGFQPPNASTEQGWDTWCDYRRQQVTDLVKKCYLEVMAIKPHVKVTADTQAYGNLASGFTSARPYAFAFQDWRTWMQDHILDAAIPMDYMNDSVEYEAKVFRDWAQFSVDNRYGRHSYVGMATYENTVTNSVTQIYSALGKGADGVSTFCYGSTNNEGRPASDLYNSIRANLFTSPVATPDMPWKTAPTTGIIFGNVTDASHPNDPIYRDWIYKATVTVTGPVTRSTLTDATGTYGFIDLPPGCYTITCAKTGFPTRAYANQRIEPGDVLREDFEMGYTTIVSPPGVVVDGWSLISLPAEPADPDPAVVFHGIDLDGRLQRWDNPSQSLLIYDPWGPEAFGSLALGAGYWLDSSAAGTISYRGLAGSPLTHDIPIPSAGWALIGCPFDTEKRWPNVVVRHGNEAASMLDASYTKNWLNSSGYWWDSAAQGLCDFGLPEFFATTEALLPWHGYWVETYVDGLTLTVR